MSEDTGKFVGSDGEFKPTHERQEGTITLEYLEELLEWTYYHDNITPEEKEKNILRLEDMVEELLEPMNANYIRTWSKKLNNNKDE